MFRTLLKAEEAVQRGQREQEEGEKLIAELTVQLKTLEEQAGDIMKSCQDAEVTHIHTPVFQGVT